MTLLKVIEEIPTIYANLNTAAKKSGCSGGIPEVMKKLQPLLCGNSDTSTSNNTATSSDQPSSESPSYQTSSQQQSTTQQATSQSSSNQASSKTAGDEGASQSVVYPSQTQSAGGGQNNSMSYIQVQVPPGAVPGSIVHVQVPGENRTIGAAIPAGVSSFHVAYQPMPVQGSDDQQGVVVNGFQVESQ